MRCRTVSSCVSWHAEGLTMKTRNLWAIAWVVSVTLLCAS